MAAIVTSVQYLLQGSLLEAANLSSPVPPPTLHPAFVVIGLSCGCSLRWRGAWMALERAFLPESSMGEPVPALVAEALRAGLGGETPLCPANSSLRLDDGREVVCHGGTFGPAV